MTSAEIVQQVMQEMQAIIDHPTKLAGNIPLQSWVGRLSAARRLCANELEALIAGSPSLQEQVTKEDTRDASD